LLAGFGELIVRRQFKKYPKRPQDGHHQLVVIHIGQAALCRGWPA
jgi:hypothetical protein